MPASGYWDAGNAPQLAPSYSPGVGVAASAPEPPPPGGDGLPPPGSSAHPGGFHPVGGSGAGVGAGAPTQFNCSVGREHKPLVIIPLCRKGDRAGIEKQLQAGATIDETDQEGNTPLHVAVEAPKNEIATVQVLLESGAVVNATNYIGASPLHYVCLRKSNHRGIANILLENGAEINSQTFAGRSTLHFACENQLPELVEVLCLFAADTNLLDSEGNTPMHLALAKEGGRDTQKRQIVEHLLAMGAEFKVPNMRGMLPVHLACRAGYIRCVQLLMERQADISNPTSRGETCVHLACCGNHAEITQMLIQHSTSQGISPSLDAADIEGNTPLHVCATVGSLDCAIQLLRTGVDTNLKNGQKKTAFDLAKIRGTDLNSSHNPELLQVLKDAKKGGTCRQS